MRRVFVNNKNNMPFAKFVVHNFAALRTTPSIHVDYFFFACRDECACLRLVANRTA